MRKNLPDLQITVKIQTEEGEKTFEWPADEGKFHIDPKSIPDSVYQTASRTLNTCIRRALSTPEGRASFEAWKREKGLTE